MDEEEEALFEKLVNTEYLVQFEFAGFEATLAGVQLALQVLRLLPSGEVDPFQQALGSTPSELHEQALRYLFTFGNWQSLLLESADKAILEEWEEEE